MYPQVSLISPPLPPRTQYARDPRNLYAAQVPRYLSPAHPPTPPSAPRGCRPRPFPFAHPPMVVLILLPKIFLLTSFQTLTNQPQKSQRHWSGGFFFAPLDLSPLIGFGFFFCCTSASEDYSSSSPSSLQVPFRIGRFVLVFGTTDRSLALDRPLLPSHLPPSTSHSSRRHCCRAFREKKQTR